MARAAHATDAAAVCGEPAPPPAEASWGPAWVTDAYGAVQPELVVYAIPGAEHWAEFKVLLADRAIAWVEGPLYADVSGQIQLDLTIPAELDGRIARATVLVTAYAGERRIASRGELAYLWSDGTPHLVRSRGEAAAVTVAAVEAAMLGTASPASDEALEMPIGAEVTP